MKDLINELKEENIAIEIKIRAAEISIEQGKETIKAYKRKLQVNNNIVEGFNEREASPESDRPAAALPPSEEESFEKADANN